MLRLVLLTVLKLGAEFYGDKRRTLSFPKRCVFIEKNPTLRKPCRLSCFSSPMSNRLERPGLDLVACAAFTNTIQWQSEGQARSTLLNLDFFELAACCFHGNTVNSSV